MEKLKFTEGQLKPKDGKRWLEMVGFHKQIPRGCLKIPAEQWYYFYMMGIQKGKEELFDDFKKEVRKFRLERTGQQEVSMMVRKLKERHLSNSDNAKTNKDLTK